jgi:putative transposase
MGREDERSALGGRRSSGARGPRGRVREVLGQMALPGVRKRPPASGGRWGGRREGAGRKPANGKAGVSHARRPEQSATRPLHITIRLVRGLPRLRGRRGYQLARRALALANRHPGVRLCEVSIQANHLHFVGELDDRAALTRAMRSFNISFARNVNRSLAGKAGEPRRGRVLADRYHIVVLRTPAQTRAALEYVLGNWRRHDEDRGAPRRRTDRFSSGPFFTGWLVPAPDFLWWKDLPWPEDGPLPIRFPRSWLLRTGWKRGGLLSPWHRPGPRA